jgi:tRNA pseudouridine32 synthase / 23S rRNA pseudouridine746 synthase
MPPGPWRSLLDGLCARFPTVGREAWLGRFERGRVLDGAGTPLSADTAYRTGMEVYYFREVAAEAAAAPGEQVLHVDEHLVVADKPHGLPVTPAGEAVAETLLARLVLRLGNPHLVPLHRIDRDTAGLVLFSASPASRAAYHALFSDHRIVKTYEALAPPLPSLTFPIVHRSRLVRGEPFFRMREAAGEANSETHVDVAHRGAHAWRYVLAPRTGRKHQLRVHMAALGAPIFGDILYPELQPREATERMARQRLQLLARRLSFVDPLDQRVREYESRFQLRGRGTD